MPISSLPSPHGIGTFGSEAYAFVDHLEAAGQKYWQVLPFGPTSYGDSPYASFSAFAGNPYFIDLDFLIEEGLLTSEYVDSIEWCLNEQDIDYKTLFDKRFVVLRKAFDKSKHKDLKEYKDFEKANKWLDDYADYMAFKIYYKNKSWQEWPENIRKRKKDAIIKLKNKLAKEIDFQKFLQFKFFEQWKKLKAYANEKGIGIIGDIPVYVALDSADVWANPKDFQLNKNLECDNVAGVPPDAFSKDGQRWGNPLYDWENMEEEDFKWWRERMSFMAKTFDVIRIDHFLGLVKYYSIPTDSETAKIGKYIKGPGNNIIKAINESVGDKMIIAEDLGIEMPEAKTLIKKSGYPSMKVLEFAFDGDRKNTHLPYNYVENCVVYGGTHDNDTLLGYFSNLDWWNLEYVREFIGDAHAPLEKLVEALFREAYKSVANLVIFQMQDVLMLDSSGRMNVPSTIGTNWKWRMKKGAFDADRIGFLRYLCDIYNR